MFWYIYLQDKTIRKCQREFSPSLFVRLEVGSRVDCIRHTQEVLMIDVLHKSNAKAEILLVDSNGTTNRPLGGVHSPKTSANTESDSDPDHLIVA